MKFVKLIGFNNLIEPQGTIMLETALLGSFGISTRILGQIKQQVCQQKQTNFHSCWKCIYVRLNLSW